MTQNTCYAFQLFEHPFNLDKTILQKFSIQQENNEHWLILSEELGITIQDFREYIMLNVPENQFIVVREKNPILAGLSQLFFRPYQLMQNSSNDEKVPKTAAQPTY